jgi:hypothetical protein
VHSTIPGAKLALICLTIMLLIVLSMIRTLCIIRLLAGSGLVMERTMVRDLYGVTAIVATTPLLLEISLLYD